MRIQTILTPYFIGQHLPGLEAIHDPGWLMIKEPLPDSADQERMSVLHGALARFVEDALKKGLTPVSLAGDCCAAIGVWAGIKRAGIDPLLIWLDAHGDFNTWETSPSGFLGGMPLAMLAGLGEQTLLEALDLDPLPQAQIILTDGRDLDPGERELVVGSGITHLEDPRMLREITLPDQPIWVHFDTDVLDPEDVPAQNYLAPGGIHKEELAGVFQYLSDTGNLCAVSLSSWAPDLPGAEVSKQVCLELLEILIQ